MTFSVSDAFVYLATAVYHYNASFVKFITCRVFPEKINPITRGEPRMEKLFCVIWLYQLAQEKKKKSEKCFPQRSSVIHAADHFTSPFLPDTQLTSGLRHPSGDHYKLGVVTCTLQSPHLCLFLQSPCTVYRTSTSSTTMEKKKKKPASP